MTIACPSCGTTYRVPTRPRRGSRPTFECSACGHVFEPGMTLAQWDDDEPFVLDGGEQGSEAEDRGPTFVGADPDAEPEVLEDDAEEEEEEQEEEQEEEDVDRPTRRPAPRRTRRDRGARQRRTRPSPARFALRCLLTVVLGYAGLGIYVTTFPDDARAFMTRIPVVGVHLARTRLGPSEIAIDDVRGSFQRLADRRDTRTALVVTGTATNHARVPVEGIELAIHLMGETTATERVPCTGTVVDVTQLTERELGLMTRLHRTRTARVEPGASIVCQAVFLEYPAGLERATLDVAAARGR